jgi:hypothetical protein
MALQQEITWSAPEYHYYEKSTRWYGAVAVLAGALMLIALVQKNFLFAFFAVIAGFLVSFWGKRVPQTIPFALKEKELTINNRRSYLYEKCGGFTIIETPNHPPELVLKTQERLHPWLRIIIPKNQEEAIRTLLLEHMQEIEYTESLGDHIARMLKF